MRAHLRSLWWIAVAVSLSGCSSCGRVDCAGLDIDRGGDYLCDLPGYGRSRDYAMHVPAGFDGSTALPVVLALHGGGGNRDSAERVTCSGGDLGSDTCLSALADREGFIVVRPNGTSSVLLREVRTWNAGGGRNGWDCVSGRACEEGVDDIAFFNTLLDNVEQAVAVDGARVYATGLSNGGAMSHRLACELADRVTAVAPVGGANQLATSQACTPARPVPILHIHGTADPCWPYAGGPGSCIDQEGDKVAVDVSITGMSGLDPGWVARDGCDPTPTIEDLPDTAADGMTTTRSTWSGCDGGVEVQLVAIDGGGHTWPQGYQYTSASTVGEATQDFNANEMLWAFFSRFSN